MVVPITPDISWGRQTTTKHKICVVMTFVQEEATECLTDLRTEKKKKEETKTKQPIR